MTTNLTFIAICSGITLAGIIVLISILLYGRKTQKEVRGNILLKADKNDWLFHDINNKLYPVVFGDKKPEQVLTNFKVDTMEYIKDCRLTREDPMCTSVAMYHVYCAIFMAACSFISIATSSAFIFLIGVSTFFLIPKRRVNRIGKKAKDMRNEVSNELSTFLSMLLSQLEVGMNIEVAIRTLCQLYDCLLSREFNEAMTKSQMGASTWESAMTEVSSLYGIEAMDDFVMSASIAAEKGTSITEIIRQKAKEIRETQVSRTKEDAGKMTSLMNIPLLLFCVVPSILFMIIPTMTTLNGGLF